MKWIILFFLMAHNSYGAIWIPHEKEIWGIIRRAEKTPQMLIEHRYPGIEKLNVDRRHELIEDRCQRTSMFCELFIFYHAGPSDHRSTQSAFLDSHHR